MLIRINREKQSIETALCTRDHKIFRIFEGKSGPDVIHTIFEHERRSSEPWFSSPEHIAYLGRELKKADIALQNNSDYLQE